MVLASKIRNRVVIAGFAPSNEVVCHRPKVFKRSCLSFSCSGSGRCTTTDAKRFIFFQFMSCTLIYSHRLTWPPGPLKITVYIYLMHQSVPISIALNKKWIGPVGARALQKVSWSWSQVHVGYAFVKSNLVDRPPKHAKSSLDY